MHYMCNTAAQPMQVQQVRLADINRMANLHTCTSCLLWAVRTVSRQGSVRDHNRKVGTSKERPTSGLALSV